MVVHFNSSPHNRDSNLIPHPDYDYYERDRITANCRASPCIDCGSNPGYVNKKPQTPYRPAPAPTPNNNYNSNNNNNHNNNPNNPDNNKPPSYETDRVDRYRPEVTAIDKYRPQNNFYESRPGQDSWDRYGGANYFANGGEQHFNRPPVGYPEPRPPYGFNIDRYGTEDSGSDYNKPPPYRPMPPPSSGGGYIDSGDFGYNRPQKPYGERPIPPPPRPVVPESDYNRPQSPPDSDYNRPPSRPDSDNNRPPSRPDSDYNRPPSRPDSDYNRPPSRPDSDYNRPPSRPDSDYNRPPSRPDSDYNRPQPVIPIHKPSDYDRPDAPYRPSKPEILPPSGGYGGQHEPPSRPLSPSGGYGHHEPPQSPPPRPGIGYMDREPHPPYHPTNFHQKPSNSFIPYLIGQDNAWGMYGGTYGSTGGSISYRPQVDYWGIRNEIKRKDEQNHFNYFELGPHEENSVYNRYGGPSGYGDRPHHNERPSPPQSGYDSRGPANWGQMWTRRPGAEGEKSCEA